MPFNKIDECEVLKSTDSQSRHLGLKPLCSRSSNMYSHEIVSKAFEISSLKRRAGVFFRWYALARFLTNRKLSWMHLPFIKALCELDTKFSIWPDSLMANVFVISLLKELMRLIGLKSFGHSGKSIFGMRTILAPFNFSKGPTLRS